MNQKQATNDRLTLLLFKDNLTARAFEVPLKWITQLGVLLALLALSTFIAIALAGHYYWVSLKASPDRVEDLQQEVSRLKSTMHELELKPTALTILGSSESNIPQALPSNLPQDPKPKEIEPTLSTQPQEITPTPTPQVLVQTRVRSPFDFLAFPEATQLDTPIASELPFVVKDLRAQWIPHGLQVRFNLQYIRGDSGYQQGRIVMLARGPGLLASYPNTILNEVGSPSLLSPEKGEFFSVSRYREVKGDFRTTDNHSIKQVEVFLFSKSGELLYYNQLTPPQSPIKQTPQHQGNTRRTRVKSAPTEKAPEAPVKTDPSLPVHSAPTSFKNRGLSVRSS